MTAPDVLQLVCWFYQLDKEMVLSKVRIEGLVRAREAFVLLCREEKDMSYSSIARALNKHHTSIISAYKRALNRDGSFFEEISFLKKSMSCVPQHMSASYVQ